MNKVKIIDKLELSADQVLFIKKRLKDPVHEGDAGPPKVWDTYKQYLYAVIRSEDEAIIGLVEASGRPESFPGWWIDSKYRNQKYGYQLVDALAEYLIKDGVEKIGGIRIQGNSQEYSKKLVQRLREKFDVLYSGGG